MLGEYHADSAAVCIDYSMADLHDAQMAYQDLPDVEPEDAEQFVTRVCDYDAKHSLQPTVALDALMAFLTYEHEAEHHRIVATTPFGLLMWRVSQALRVNLEYLFHAESRAVFGDFEACTRPAALAVERWLNERLGDPPLYADAVCWECHVLRAYLAALLDGRGMTRLAFVNLANVAEKILAVRSGVEIGRRIIVVDPNKALLPLVPDGVPTALEIMEATAVLNEEVLLISKRVAPALLEEWQETSLHGVYSKAHAYFRSRFGFSRFGKLAADVSFCGPADICATQSDALPIDLMHPSLLLDRIARHVEGRLLPADMMLKTSTAIPFDDELFGGAIAAGLDALAHAELWNDNFISPRRDATQPPQVAGVPLNSVDAAIAIAQLRQEAFKDAMRVRLQGFGQHSNTVVQETPYAPQIIAFRDGLTFPQISARRSGNYDEARKRGEQLEAQLLLRDYASSCAVRKVVLGVPPPQFLEGDESSFAHNDFRGFAAAAYRRHFELPTP